MRPRWDTFVLGLPHVGVASHKSSRGSLLVKEVALLLETLEDKPSSKSWHPILMVSLCVAGAFAIRMLVDWSCSALANAWRNPPVESAPNVHVGKDAPGR